MGIYTKLAQIQNELSVPKNREIFTKKGKMNYRKYEDILKALKPLLNKQKVCLFMSDEVEVVTPERVYIKTTAKLVDLDTEDVVESTAFAREDVLKEQAQDGVAPKMTLSASSYARKSALLAMFCIDESSEERTWEDKIQKENTSSEGVLTLEEIEREFAEMNRKEIINMIYKEMKQKNIQMEAVCSNFKVEQIENLCINSLARIYFALYKAKKK